jgi:hypothetical protein
LAGEGEQSGRRGQQTGDQRTQKYPSHGVIPLRNEGYELARAWGGVIPQRKYAGAPLHRETRTKANMMRAPAENGRGAPPSFPPDAEQNMQRRRDWMCPAWWRITRR